MSPPNEGGGPDQKAETATTTATVAASNGSGPTDAVPALDDIGKPARAPA